MNQYTGNDWTALQIARLGELWDQRDPQLSMAEIAKAFGLSKNAICGKVHRLGLAARPSPIKPKGSGANPKKLSRAAAKRAIALPEVASLQAAPIPAPVVVAAPRLAPVATGECMWPTKQIARSRWLFCGEPSHNKRSYCEAHCCIAYVRPARLDERLFA